MAKYRFHELRKRCPQWKKLDDDPKPLPEDVNDPVEKIADRFGYDGLSEMLRTIRTKKLFGTGIYYDEKGRMTAEFDYQHGMCPRLKLVEYHGDRALFFRSIHNDNLDMSKESK